MTEQKQLVGSNEAPPIDLSNIKLQINEVDADHLPKQLTIVLARLSVDTTESDIRTLFT